MNWLAFAISALLLYGLWGFLPKLVTENLDPRSAWLFEMFGFSLSTLVIALLSGFRMQYQPRGALLAFTMGIISSFGLLFFFFAASRYKASVVNQIIALYPIISIVLSLTLLQESLTITQSIGIIFGILSLVFLVF